jgi:rare lipoprotein A
MTQSGKSAESSAPAAAAPPPPVAEPAGTSGATPAQSAAPPPKPQAPPPAQTGKEKLAAVAPATSAGPGWFVQAGAFRSRENADRRAAQLKTKGYAQATVVSGGASALFRVRIGPIADRTEADQIAARLQKDEGGPRPLVQR